MFVDKKIFKIDETRYPSLIQMTETLRTNHRFSSDIVKRGAELFGKPWADDFEQVLNALFPTQQALVAAVKGYASFAMHSMRCK